MGVIASGQRRSPQQRMTTENSYNYPANRIGEVKEINNGKSVVFSVQAANDAFIALGSSEEHDGSHYEILLGGWGNTKSVIRYRNQGPAYATYRTAVLERDEKRIFWVAWDDGKDQTLDKSGYIRVGTGQHVGVSEIMSAPLRPQIEILLMHIATSGGATGRWEIGSMSSATCPTSPHQRMATQKNYNYPINRIGKVKDIGDGTSIVFSVQAANDAHVALGNSEDHDGSHYEIVLGGWGNTKSVIRYRNQGPAFATHRGPVLNHATPTNFWVTWTDGMLRVGTGQYVGTNVIMSAPLNPQIKIMLMHVATGWGGTGQWKFGITPSEVASSNNDPDSTKVSQCLEETMG